MYIAFSKTDVTVKVCVRERIQKKNLEKNYSSQYAFANSHKMKHVRK